jgi:hypothetical protein
MTRSIVMITTALLAVLVAPPARAQNLLFSGEVGLASGVEAGDPGSGATEFRRARTRLAAGADTRSDEDPIQALGLRAFVEIEPHTSIGGEVRYIRWLGEHFTGFAGFTGTVAPHTLVGALVGVQAYIPLGRVSLLIEPSFSALPFGSDLPTDHLLLWGLLCVGVRGDFIRAPESTTEASR